MSFVTQKLKEINRQSLTSNTQKIAYKLLSAKGAWIKSSELGKYISSAQSRVRDLRTEQFGSFAVECATASDLHKKGGKTTFFYRINPVKVSNKQLATIFNI